MSSREKIDALTAQLQAAVRDRKEAEFRLQDKDSEIRALRAEVERLREELAASSARVELPG